MYIQIPKIVNEWLVEFFSITLLILGVPLACAGVYFIVCGESFYCFFMGVGFTASGYLVTRRLPEGVWVYLFTWAAACCWALWGARADISEALPWLVVPGIFVVPAVMLLPTLYRIRREKNLRK
ncbi:MULTISPECIES: hypothetical protein [Acetobacter]|uniref:hypothetical protein n=1 Tax=Acetobacter TaxID=434 RepID=UPI000A3D1225|nr:MULTISPECIES: hypothetical protein [Acetobacter]MBS0959237.1 hypothetical protein [Acetobacter thailandicus]MBS0980726.1 hypothetical protein [Acetobacter thailandicus]MBS0984866.1 hypothetical protein [Acetobacter thailandicus]OUI88428.1 hypothetical protein HK11_06385 [Acetobacter sp. DmW_043]